VLTGAAWSARALVEPLVLLLVVALSRPVQEEQACALSGQASAGFASEASSPSLVLRFAVRSDGGQ
jgi:hypothetical protein